MFAQSAQNYIIASRVAQGNEDLKKSSTAERHDIETRWLAQKDDLKAYFLWKQKEKGKNRDPYSSGPASIQGTESSESVAGDEAPRTGWLHTKNMTWEERKRLQEQKKAWKKKQAAAGSHVTEDLSPAPQGSAAGLRDDEFEQAIRAAVAETSRGDPFEDARVEQAIRSSIMELKRRSSVSVPSAASYQSDGQPSSNSSQTNPSSAHYGFPSEVKGSVPFSPEDLEDITDEEYQALIEQAVHLSIAEDERQEIRMHDLEEEDEDDEDYKVALQRSHTERTATATTTEEEELLKKALEASEAEHAAQAQRGVDGDDDEEEIRKAIEASQAEHARQQSSGGGDDDEEALKRALEESERAHREEQARVSAQQTEEDNMLEYIKKQSLAEEEHRLKGKGKVGAANDEDDDEELKKAIEESIRASGKAGQGSRSG